MSKNQHKARAEYAELTDTVRIQKGVSKTSPFQNLCDLRTSKMSKYFDVQNIGRKTSTLQIHCNSNGVSHLTSTQYTLSVLSLWNDEEHLEVRPQRIDSFPVLIRSLLRKCRCLITFVDFAVFLGVHFITVKVYTLTLRTDRIQIPNRFQKQLVDL